jgi:hypothetical protein
MRLVPAQCVEAGRREGKARQGADHRRNHRRGTKVAAEEAVAAVVLVGDDLRAQTHVLTGGRAITYDEIATHLSRVAGRPVAYVDVPEGRAEQELVDAGAPAWLVTHLTGAFRLIRQGALEPATATVRAITGHEPRTFDVFARDHARFFAPPVEPGG